MSVYNARRAPNVSQYIDELNQVPSSFDLSQQQPGPEDFDFEGSLAMFTNAEFPDFDVGDNGNDSIPFIDPALDGRSGKDNTTTTGNGGLTDFPLFNTDLNIPTFPEYPQYPNPLMQPTLAQGYNNATSNIQSPTTSSPLSQSSPVNQGFNHGAKRKADSVSIALPQDGSGSLEEQSRLAAEEDKRRRNTAASARFRVKKKEREKTLERSVKEVTDKNTKLELRLGQLEMENRWLRNLITEKNGSKNDVDITEMWQKFRRESEEREKADKGQKEGVGTGGDFKTES